MNRPLEPVAGNIPANFPVRRWLLVLVAAMPFQLLLMQHVWMGPSATGFLNYDSVYYAANGRAIFERGNGLTYPNPSDIDPHSPAIYFHWLIWVLGFGIKFLHLDPGVFYASLGVIGGVVCSALTLRLVELTLPDPKGRTILYLLTMWGGGVLCIAAAAVNLGEGHAWSDNLMRFDPTKGWWFQNWGRNIVLPLEAVYHCFVAWAWMAILQRRWRVAIFAVAALAATHPFSGAQHLLILGGWLGWLALRERTRAMSGRLALVGVLLAVFLLYYFWFLNRFPGHRAVQIQWASLYPVPLVSILLSAGPLLLMGVGRVCRQHWQTGDPEKFWLVSAAVSFLLMEHSWFIPAHQPAHFSRGYLWLSLWLLALPLAQSWLISLLAPPVRLTRVAGLATICALFCTDNAGFLFTEWHDGPINRVYVSPTEREMFSWIGRAELRGVLLCAEPRLSYYASAYTGVRPYLGHLVNTPDMRIRWLSVSAWQRRGETGPWMEVIDYVLIRKADPPVGFDRTGWIELHGNDDFGLLGRVPATDAGKSGPPGSR